MRTAPSAPRQPRPASPRHAPATLRWPATVACMLSAAMAAGLSTQFRLLLSMPMAPLAHGPLPRASLQHARITHRWPITATCRSAASVAPLISTMFRLLPSTPTAVSAALLAPGPAPPAFTTARYAHTSVAYNGYLYVIGGENSSELTNVQFAPINSNGSVGAWTATTSFTTKRCLHTSGPSMATFMLSAARASAGVSTMSSSHLSMPTVPSALIGANWTSKHPPRLSPPIT